MSRPAVAVRALTALAVLSALTANALGALQDGLLAQNVSYFTNHSNLLFAVLVVVGIARTARHPPWFDDARGAVAFYLVMTGIIYAVLVAPLDELLVWDIGWTGIVLHRLAPVVALADWLLTPRRGPGPARRILWWQLYPVLFLVLTWVRGAMTGWYPYDFLDPAASSWPQVLTTTAVVLIAFMTIGVVLHLLQGRLRSREAPPAVAEPAVS